MALTPSLSIAIESDRESGVLTDDTVYGTGGNPARADIRVFATGYKVSADLSEEALTMTSNTGDAQTVSSWTFNIDLDGWFKYLFVGVAEYAGGTTYALYDAVFDPADDAVYRSKQAGNLGNALSDTAWWEVITDPSSLAENEGEDNESENLAESLVYERVLSPNSQYNYSNLIAENCACSDCDPNEVVYNYEIASIWVNAMDVADERADGLSGETIARRYQSKFISSENC